MAAHVQQLPTPPVALRPDLPSALNEIILTAIEKEPGRRFQSADAFRNALGSLRGKLPLAVAVNQSALPITPATPASAGATALLQRPGVGESLNEAVTAPLEPLAQAEAIPSVIQLSERPRTHRGLYISLGALIVLVVLVVAGLYVPQTLTTRANEQKQGTEQKSNDSSAVTAGSNSVPDTDKPKEQERADADKTKAQGEDQSGRGTMQPAASKEDMTVPSAENGAGSKNVDQTQQVSSPGIGGANKPQIAPHDSGTPTKKHALKGGSKVVSSTGGNQQENKSTPSAADDQQAGYTGQVAEGTARVDASQLETLEEQTDQLSSRVTSLNDALDNLRNQQAAHGYGLRRDIASAQELMKTHLAKAQTALQNQDAAGAKKYLDLAEEDAAKIDKFLGH
jgi:serine/threonine-protein kinase